MRERLPIFVPGVVAKENKVKTADEVRVCFGEGRQNPNYQIEASGKITKFSGQNHDKWSDRPNESFDRARLTKPFTYTEVMPMFQTCTGLDNT